MTEKFKAIKRIAGGAFLPVICDAAKLRKILTVNQFQFDSET